MSDIKDVLQGATIIRNFHDGNLSVDDLFGVGKILGLYFSGHWCPPCRAFTPILRKFYDKLKQNGDTQLEILFISFDRDEQDFAEYFEGMPWPAIAYPNRHIKEQLEAKYDVQGIPRLLILDEKGEVIDSDGRTTVCSNKNSSVSPWTKNVSDENKKATDARKNKHEWQQISTNYALNFFH